MYFSKRKMSLYKCKIILSGKNMCHNLFVAFYIVVVLSGMLKKQWCILQWMVLDVRSYSISPTPNS